MIGYLIFIEQLFSFASILKKLRIRKKKKTNYYCQHTMERNIATCQEYFQYFITIEIFWKD